jgi:hypothetical protein
MLRIADKRKIFSFRDLFYYFRRSDQVPRGRKFEPLDMGKFDWEKEVLANDMIIIEANEAAIGNLGFGFVQAALNYLEADNGGA